MYVACTMSTVGDCTHTMPAYNYTTTKSPFHARSSPSRARIVCARANEGVTVSLSRMGTSRCHFRARRHRDDTFAHAETSQCHFCKGFAKLREYIANFFLHPTVTAEGVGLKIVYLLYCDCATFHLRSRNVVQLQ